MSFMWSLTAVVILCPVLSSAGFSADTTPPKDNSAHSVPHQYIVSFTPRKHISDDLIKDVIKHLEDNYDVVVKNRLNVGNYHGLVVTVPDDELVEYIAALPDVYNVEPDEYVTVGVHEECDAVTTSGTMWGLQRISQRKRLVPDYDGQFQYYTSPDNDGSGVDAYVIDTGIRTTHQEFGGRASWGYVVPRILEMGQGEHDGSGHGTHCAGSVGGSTAGVAKNVKLIAVKVLDDSGSGYSSDVILGLEWVVNRHQLNSNARKAKSVISMSIQTGGIGYGKDQALAEATFAGVVVAICAGNKYGDACTYSYARTTYPITVAAHNISDHHAEFCNWGPCVDIEAPGVNITSASNKDDHSYSRKSGCSMATPHVAGVLARYLSSKVEPPTHLEAKGWLLDVATEGAMHFWNDISINENNETITRFEFSTPNKMLYVDCMALQKDGSLVCPSDPGAARPEGEGDGLQAGDTAGRHTAGWGVVAMVLAYCYLMH